MQDKVTVGVSKKTHKELREISLLTDKNLRTIMGELVEQKLKELKKEIKNADINL